VPEPLGGAHRQKAAAIQAVGEAVWQALESLRNLDGSGLKTHRREKFLAMGQKGLG
jgi:acetyl-CoA carboxylase carboxyl transferase subunit alpha